MIKNKQNSNIHVVLFGKFSNFVFDMFQDEKRNSETSNSHRGSRGSMEKNLFHGRASAVTNK